jgi:hypothetical protein
MSEWFAHLPINQAAENNKAAILQALIDLRLTELKVFEVGSGTGQHGLHFCQHLPNMSWQPSEVVNNIQLTQAWFDAAKPLAISNYSTPIDYQIGQALPQQASNSINAIYSANVLHIVSHELAELMIETAASELKSGQLFIAYGPFKVEGGFTTESNQSFDIWLKQQGYGGLIDVSDIGIWSQQKLTLRYQHPMPANNFLLVFEKK